MADEFICSLCGGSFEKGSIPPPPGATGLICGDCFQKIGNTAGPPGPGYWMNETTGVLRPAVEAYLTHAPMMPEHIAAMRAYIRQWIGSPIWDQNSHATDEDRAWLIYLRRQVDFLTGRDEIAAWLEVVAGDTMDPL